MAETGKRIEVRYGAFACRVEGFDDPVGQLREVLSLMQRMIAETPALADHASELDDAQLARIHDALSDRRADDDTPGIVVIRGAERSGNEIADAEILGERAPLEQDERPEPRIDAPPADAAAPFPAAAVFAAPAAAVAEAAFAAMTADDDAATPDEDDAQGPLGDELPADPATAAAPFAAPAAGSAAGSAETAFAGGLASVAEPADPDDDGDPDLAWADEAAEERAPAPGAGPAAPRAFGAAGPERAAPRGLGGPGEGWTPWGSLPAAKAASEAPPDPSGPQTEEDMPAAAEADAADAADAAGDPGAHALREPAPDFDEAESGAEPLPPINIFAPPPPDEMPAAHSAEPETRADIHAAPRPEPQLSLRREPRPAAGDPEIAPDTAAPGTAEWRSGGEPFPADDGADEPDEALDDGAGDRPDPEDGPDGDPASAENRLAALITRYQSGLQERDERGPGHDDPATGLSPAQLAERAEATEVGDLLAVSAAWLTLADGRARFTRREVMEVFETLPGTHPRTLEARIKGFGNIVRSGTLQLVDEGVFALVPAERARFRALIDQG